MPFPRARSIVLALACLTCVNLAGCAIAPMEGGGYAVGLRLDGEGGTPQQVGAVVAGVAKAAGIPYAEYLGYGAAALATALGVGAHQRRKGENAGYDEASRVYSAPPPRPTADVQPN